jgi:hypothetical protein
VKSKQNVPVSFPEQRTIDMHILIAIIVTLSFLTSPALAWEQKHDSDCVYFVMENDELLGVGWDVEIRANSIQISTPDGSDTYTVMKNPRDSISREAFEAYQKEIDRGYEPIPVVFQKNGKHWGGFVVGGSDGCKAFRLFERK